MSNYKVVLNPQGKVLAYGPDVDQYVPSIPEGGSYERLTEEDLAILLIPIPKTKAQLKIEELAVLSAWRKTSMETLAKDWVNISMTVGADEVPRKAVLQENILEIKTQYSAERAAILAKYI